MSIVGDLLTEAKALYQKGASGGADAKDKPEATKAGVYGALYGQGASVSVEARDKDGVPVDTYSPEAVKFSLIGALRRAAWDRRDSTGLDHALVLLGEDYSRNASMGGLAKADDDERINALFDAAIERANGGPVKERSLDAERRLLNPNDPDYLEQVKKLEAGETTFADVESQPKQEESSRTEGRAERSDRAG